MKYACPLCKQPVSPSLYQKIMGIWEARREALTRIKEQRVRLLQRFRDKERKLRNQSSRFRKQKTLLIQEAVTKRTKPLRNQIYALRLKELEIKKTGPGHEKSDSASPSSSGQTMEPSCRFTQKITSSLNDRTGQEGKKTHNGKG